MPQAATGAHRADEAHRLVSLCANGGEKARAVHSKAKYRERMLVVLLVVIAVLLLVPLVGAALWAVITAAILGLIIGGLARLVLPGQQKIGLGMTVLLGWVGSLVGGLWDTT